MLIIASLAMTMVVLEHSRCNDDVIVLVPHIVGGGLG